MYPIYRNISNWLIINEAIIHDFDENERAIPIVNVLIGTLHYMRKNMDNKMEDARTPITRWMTRTQFNNYRQGK